MKKITFLLVLPLLLLSGCATQESSEIAYGQKYINSGYGYYGSSFSTEAFTFRKDGTVIVTIRQESSDLIKSETEYGYILSNGYMIINGTFRCEINEKFMVYYPLIETKGRLYFTCINENYFPINNPYW